MTASSMPCSPSRADPFYVLRLLLAALLLWAAAPLAGAAEIEVRSATLTVGEESLLLNADFRIDLGMVLEDVVAHGVPLYFIAEFELTRPRWYWLNETLADKTRQYRLSYHALTRQYRLSSGALFQNFSTLQEALAILSRVRNWSVADRSQLKTGDSYQAAVRLRLDWAQLPKPLQVTTIASREWALGSDWLRWNAVATDPK